MTASKNQDVPAKQEAPSKWTIGIAAILVPLAVLFLMTPALVYEKSPSEAPEWLAMMGGALSLGGWIAAWKVRQHVVGRACLLMASAVVVAFFWRLLQW